MNLNRFLELWIVQTGDSEYVCVCVCVGDSIGIEQDINRLYSFNMGAKRYFWILFFFYMDKLFVARLYSRISSLCISIKLLKVGIVYNKGVSLFFLKKTYCPIVSRFYKIRSQNFVLKQTGEKNEKKSLWCRFCRRIPLCIFTYIYHIENLPVWYNLMLSKKFEMVYAFNTPVPTKYNTAILYITMLFGLDGKMERNVQFICRKNFHYRHLHL